MRAIFFPPRNQSGGWQSKSRDITRSSSQSMRTETVTANEYFVLDKKKKWINVINLMNLFSVDPDQTLRSVASVWSLHSLPLIQQSTLFPQACLCQYLGI